MICGVVFSKLWASCLLKKQKYICRITSYNVCYTKLLREKGKKANTGDGFPVIYPNVLHEYLEMVEYKQILTEDNMFYKKTIVGYKALKPGKLKMGYYFNGRIDGA